MQVILLTYPEVTGEVALKDKTGLIACESLKFDIKKKGDIGQPSYGDHYGLRRLFGEDDGAEEPVSAAPSEDQGSGVSGITLTRKVDSATPKFMALAFKKSNDEVKQATITVYRAFERQVSNYGAVASTTTAATSTNIDTDTTMAAWHEPFLVITLKGVRIASHEVDITDSELSETLEISFKEITMDYTVFKNGKNKGVITGTVKVTDPSAA